MPVRPDPVEDYPGDPGRGIERGKPVQQCGDAVALAACIDHQDHRRAKQTGDVSRRTRRRHGRGMSDPPVEQPHHAFDHRDLRAVGAVGVQRPNQPLPHQDRVEVASGPAGRQRVVAGVDEVRAHLERRDRMPGLSQRTDQTRCDRGLSAARRGCGDDDGRDAHHSMPFCPLRPASIGCLTLVISVTKSAASTSRCGASRPVITTC